MAATYPFPCSLSSSANDGTGRSPPGAGPAGYPSLSSISLRLASLVPNLTLWIHSTSVLVRCTPRSQHPFAPMYPLFWRLSSSTKLGTGTLPPGAGPAGYPSLASISRRVGSLWPNFTPLFCRLSSSTKLGTGTFPPGAGPAGYPSRASISRLVLSRCPN